MQQIANEEIRVIDQEDKYHMRLRVTFDMVMAGREPDVPWITECRHAVLPLALHTSGGEPITGYVIYDRLLNRIIDGVYYMPIEDVLEQAAVWNDPEYAWLHEDKRAPNGDALGLIYPASE